MGLEPANIISLEQGGSGSKINCMFNPNEYTMQKQNNWAREQTAGSSVPQLEFGGGLPATLQMTLFFDTTHLPPGTQDVREGTNQLWHLMMVDENLKDPKNKKGRPPKVRFMWGKGSAPHFDAVILNMSQRFTYFAANGTPLRATVQVTLQQIMDDKQLPAQNPTSGGNGGERVWTVREGDRLWNIAHAVYGSAARWRLIANENGLDGVRDLKPGTRLLIPTL
jgi:hypothetical protein